MRGITKKLLFLLFTSANANSIDCCPAHPSFSLEPLNLSSYYTYATPSAAGPKTGNISFDLKRVGANSTATCSGMTSMPFGQFYSFQIFACKSADGEKNSFAFESDTKLIHINSTWSCGGDVVFETAVSGTVELQCETSVWTNPDWKRGELYSNTSMTCQPGSLVIQG